METEGHWAEEASGAGHCCLKHEGLRPLAWQLTPD